MEYCILFLYHKADDTTLKHLQLLKQFNPDAIIIPVTDTISPQEYFPGTVDVQQFGDPFTKASSKWRDIDISVYSWFKHAKVHAMRFFLIEYDVYCTAPLKEIYKAVWDAEVAVVDFTTPEQSPDWWNFNQIPNLPKELQTFAGATRPFVGTMLSFQALEKIVDCFYTKFSPGQDLISEIRLGTIIRYLRLKVKEHPTLRDNWRWHEYFGATSNPGLYHGIKTPLPEVVISSTIIDGKIHLTVSNESSVVYLLPTDEIEQETRPLKNNQIAHDFKIKNPKSFTEILPGKAIQTVYETSLECSLAPTIIVFRFDFYSKRDTGTLMRHYYQEILQCHTYKEGFF